MAKKNEKFEVSKEKRDHMIGLIQSYFYKERDEELGELAATLILDFFIDKLATEFYNQGVEDCYKYMNEKLEDLLGLQKL